MKRIIKIVLFLFFFGIYTPYFLSAEEGPILQYNEISESVMQDLVSNYNLKKYHVIYESTGKTIRDTTTLSDFSLYMEKLHDRRYAKLS